MTLRNLMLSAFIIVAALSLTVSCSAFTSGNILAVKAEIPSSPSPLKCTKGYVTELTPAGEIVQEIALPTEEADGTLHPCLVFNDDYASRLTVSNDGYRAIMSCCNYINDTDSLISFAVIYGNGVIQTTAPFAVDNGTVSKAYNAVLDGEDIWFSTSGAVYYTTLTSNTSTLVFSNDVFTVRSNEGNLYASNYGNMEAGIVQVGEGLPKILVNYTVFLDSGPIAVNAFEFTEKYLTVGVYPNGLYVLNKTTHEPIYSNNATGEVVQLIVFEDQGKILAHMDGDSSTALYEFTFNDTIGLPNGTLWLSNYNTSAYYYFGLVMAPGDSCQDRVKNFDETDVDCGGSLCSARCVDGKTCSVASDCSSNVCTNGVCGLPIPVSTPTTSSSSPISQKSPTAATSSSNALLVNFITGAVLLGLITLL